MNSRRVRQALISAVEKGDLESLQSLISDNSVFDIAQSLNDHGEKKYLENILFYALELRKEEIAIFLIDTGKFKLIPTEEFSKNRNVVHVAAEAKCNKVLKHLLSIKDLNITQSGLYGWNLLHFAAAYGDITTVSLVLDTELFDINCVETYFGKGETPLHAAAPRAKRELIQFLIDKGANVNALTSSDQITVIRIAIRNENFEAVETLLENNADYFGGATEELATQLSFSLESILEEVCDVSDPNDAIRLLGEITKNFRLWTINEPSLEDAVSINERLKSQLGHDLYKDLIATINKDFQFYRYEKKCIYQLRQILREDERSIWAIDGSEPNYDNFKHPFFTKSNSAFVSVKRMMEKFYPDLQAGEIAIATYKLILARKRELQEKISLLSSQADELKRLKEEVALLKTQVKSEPVKEVEEARDAMQGLDQRYVVSNTALLALHKQRLARQEQMKHKSAVQQEKKLSYPSSAQ